jgi:DNA-binding NarL/FixJ family response regulator
MIESRAETRVTAGSLRILIADDNARVRRALSVLLAAIEPSAESDTLARELQVVGEAADGEEAVQIVAERQPDVVIMDAQMPTMDGIEATRAIKKNWPHVRIVMLTVDPEYRAAAQAAGADAFLVKGFTPRELLKALGGTP